MLSDGQTKNQGTGDQSSLILGIRADRMRSAFTIALSVFFLLCGYEFIRSVSASLFIHAYGSKNLPVAMALGPVVTFLLLYGYGRLLSVTGPRLAILATCGFSAVVILACYGAIRAGSKPATAVLYAFREGYIVLLIEQVWSFINSTVRTEEGKKLNGPICGIASLGAILGGLLVNRWAVSMGTENLLLLAAGSLVPTALTAWLAYHITGEPPAAPDEARGRHGHTGVRTLLQQPVLWRLALLIALTQVVSTLADLQFNHYVELALPSKDARTEWFGGFYAGVNAASAVFQFIVAPLVLAFIAPRIIHLAIPIVHCGMAAAVLFRPGLASAGGCYLVFKTLDYSVFRAVKELLYIPLSFDARYRAKEVIDAFVYRAAKGVMSGALVGIGWLAVLPAAAYPGFIFVALAGWFGLAHQLTRRRD